MINFYQNLFTTIARLKIGYFIYSSNRNFTWKKKHILPPSVFEIFQFFGGSVSHPQSTCRCARMPRSASSRFADLCLPYHREEKRGQPTLSENQRMSLSVLWNFHEDVLEKNKLWCFCKKIWCTPKKLMKKSWGCKKNNMFHLFFGFFGEHLNKIASL